MSCFYRPLPAADCRQRRPGESFNKRGKSSKPEVIDKEYEAFLHDMGAPKKTKKNEAEDAPYVPPDMGLKQPSFSKPAPPLMLTNGSSAPGAASAHARAVSSGQQTPGGALQVMGRSIFGGKLTRLTSGFRSKSEQEHEEERRRREVEAGRPVPLEWQVERYEKGVEKRQEEYMRQLERRAAEARRSTTNVPPTPSSTVTSQTAELPELIGTPLSGLWR